MNIKISFLLFLFLHFFAVQSFASGCCKVVLGDAQEHEAQCRFSSAGGCMSGTLAIGFSAIAKTYVSVPALCIGNSIAAGCTGGLSCFMFVCAVRHYTCMQIAQEQQNGRLLVPSQQSMILSPDSGQERVGFSPISDVTS